MVAITAAALPHEPHTNIEPRAEDKNWQQNLEAVRAKQHAFRIGEETIISFSGGRTSGFMLYCYLQANGGELPENAKVCFTNTGKEREETLVFVNECSERWNVPVVWLEYDRTSPELFRICDFETASRKGEPFAALIDSKSYLPNPVIRFCTAELKIRTVKRYAMKHLGWQHW